MLAMRARASGASPGRQVDGVGGHVLQLLRGGMSDPVFFGLAGLAVVLMIALALVWPQGLGQRSPSPFGHPTPSEMAAETPRLKGAL